MWEEREGAVCVLAGREVPAVELFPEGAVTVSAGGSALFQCRVNAGAPPPELAWSRADRRPLPASAEILDGGVIRSAGHQGTPLMATFSLGGSPTLFWPWEESNFPPPPPKGPKFKQKQKIQ